MPKIVGSLLLATCVALSARAGTSNSLMDISADGQLLACSNRDSGTVTIVDLNTHRVLREIPVGEKPEGVSFVGETTQVAVAVYAEDVIKILNASTGEITAVIPVFDEPYGVVSNQAGDRLLVTLDYPGRVVTIDPAAQSVIASHEVGQFVRGIALDANEATAYVTEYYTAKTIAVEISTGRLKDEWAGASTDNLLRQITLHPTRPKAYVPHIRSRVTAVHGEGSIFPYVSVIDTASGKGRRRKRVPMDAFLGNRVTANPWEIAVTPNGQQLFVVFGGTNDMFACKVLDDNYRELSYRKLIQLGANPRAVRVSPDGNTVYVYNALDFNVVGYSTQSLDRIAEIQVTENPLSQPQLEGKKLFYSALQPMVGRRWISCSSCHPDGDPDGRTWHNPEGLRNTQSLAGMKWTHPIHWSADRDEVQDFEHTIRGPLMQGRGLIRGKVNESLSEPNRGLSDPLDALAAYSNSHKISLSPHAKSGLSESAQRGRELFFSAKTNCSTCHSGPFFTDSIPRAADEIVRHDVGTGQDDPSELMGPAYDTPTLLGIYRTAPYLHHGKAASLSEVLTKYNQGDRHGKTSHLKPDQIRDLVEFLKSLPYEDPDPIAKQTGMKKVEG